MPMPHETRHHEKAPHEVILERLDKIEDILARLSEKIN